jgi:hypothetical protein
MCLCSHHWILSIICLKEDNIFILDHLDIDESTYKNSSIVFKGKQHINRVLITNLVITVVTNDDLFRNSGYK